MFIKNCWYVAGWNHEFTDTDLFKCTIINRPLVIYRKSDGRYVALEDRCSHRALPLSRGRREGDDLRCMYHGFKFAPSGDCVEMPGHDRVTGNACVRTYPVVEAHSWVWVWMGDPARADPALIPSCIGLDTPGQKSRSGHIEYDAYYELINDNLLDFSHLGYVHPTSFGATEDWAYTRPTVTRLPRGVRVERWIKDQPATNMDFDGRVDIWSSYDYLLPGVLVMSACAVPAGAAALHGNGAPDVRKTPPVFSQSTCQAVTPISESRSRYSFSVLMDEPDEATGMLDKVWFGTQQAFAEDRVIIETQARSIALDPDRKMVPSIFDAALGQFRWLVKKAVMEESTVPQPAVAA